MKFFNATNKTVVGLLSLLLLLAAGELTGLLNAGEANGDGSTPMSLPSSLSTRERSSPSRP